MLVDNWFITSIYERYHAEHGVLSEEELVLRVWMDYKARFVDGEGKGRKWVLRRRGEGRREIGVMGCLLG